MVLKWILRFLVTQILTWFFLEFFLNSRKKKMTLPNPKSKAKIDCPIDPYPLVKPRHRSLTC